MDNCCEQNVQKARTAGDTAKIAAILVLSALLAAVGVFFGWMSGELMVLAFAFAFAIGMMALGVWLTGFMIIEYEYILTNNEMDIDKIIGRRTRRRMITIDLSKATELAEYPTAAEVKRDVTVLAASSPERGARYLLTEHSDYGVVMVIFNPNEKLTEAMLKEFPSALCKTLKREVDK